MTDNSELDPHLTYLANVALQQNLNPKERARLYALVSYAITRSRNDPEWANQMQEKAKEAGRQDRLIEFISLVIKDAQIPSLIDAEKEKLIKKTPEEIFSYLIERTKKLGYYEKNVRRLEQVQSWRLDTKILDLFLEFQTKFMDLLSNHEVCRRYSEISQKKDLFQTQSKSKFSLPIYLTKEMALSGKKYVSIDMKAGNFSVFFFFWGYHILGIEPAFFEYDQLANALTDNEFLRTSKEMRGACFGKLVKVQNMALERAMTYLMNIVLNKMLDLGFTVVVFNLDEVVIESDSQDHDEQEKIIKAKIRELEPQMGKYMIERFRIEPFTLELVNMPNNKELVLKKTANTTRLYNMDPQLAHMLSQ